MKKTETTNSFQDGLISDLNPLVTPNSILVNALNATTITMRGNENVLQNDMGNGRVETAYLPEGYVPLGTTELGGIIYIVSYNPITNKCQIGSFPSPERNITTDELGDTTKTLDTSIFYSTYTGDIFTSLISSPSYKLTLTDDILNPGDKFVIFNSDIESLDYISAKTQELIEPNADLYPKYLKLSVICIQDNGEINSLNDSLTWYIYSGNDGYYIYNGEVSQSSDGALDLDEYRNLVQSNYSVFTSKISGKLGILAELEVINAFEIAWDAYKVDGKWNIYFLLNWSYENELSHDKVNLYGIKVEEIQDSSTVNYQNIIITTYPKSDNSSLTSNNDSLTNQETTFYSPTYVKGIAAYNEYVEENSSSPYALNENITTARYNDGTDNQFFLETPYVVSSDSGIIILQISPVMPFGVLDYLKSEISIDIDQLGSGKINLEAYKYYWETNQITLNWSLESYPEYNKSINSVTFSFYEYNEEVSEWIVDNAEEIDSCRIETSNSNSYWYKESEDSSEEWVESGSASLYDGTVDYELTIDNKASYSGYFSNTIEGLNNSSLYLVAINIDYNGEKTITYYRFMYTSKIFNNYYLTVEDFKDIVLQDAIDTYYPITISTSDIKTNFLKEESVTDSEGNKISEFPYAQDEFTIEEYTLNSIYDKNNITFTVNVTNEVLQVNINEISVDTSNDISVETSNNAEETTVYTSSSTVTSTSNLDDIEQSTEISDVELEVNNGSASGSLLLTQTIKSPFIITYSTNENINIDYEMSQLTYNVVNLVVSGRHKAIYMSAILDEEGNCPGNSDNAYADTYGDDVDIKQILKSFTGTYSLLESYIAGKDMLLMRMYTWYGATDNPAIVVNSNNKNSYYWGYKSKESTFPCVLGYAIRNSSGIISIFVPKIKRSTYYGVTLSSVNETGNNSVSSDSQLPVVCKYKDLTESKMFAPFSNCYKLVNSSQYITKYALTTICFYDNYIWSLILNIPCNLNISLIINNIDLITADNIPNNLQYSKELNKQIYCKLSDTIYTDTYINNITDYSNQTLTLDLNGNIVDAELSNKKIYDNNLNELSYLIAPDGYYTDPLSILSSTIKIGVDNSTGLIYTDGTNSVFGIKFRQEDQALQITNILQMV